MTRTKTRALANWPNNAVSVLDFGAVGDGVTDDTAAIQAAIDAAYGRTLCIPSGTYKVSAGLAIEQSVTIVGDGQGLTNIKYTGSNKDISILVNITSDFVTLRRLTIECDITNYNSSGDNVDMVQLNTSTNNLILDEVGLIGSLQPASGRVGFPTARGVLVNAPAKNCTITNCYFKHLRWGVWSQSSYGSASASTRAINWTVDNCKFDEVNNSLTLNSDPDDGGVEGAWQDVTVSNCVFYGEPPDNNGRCTAVGGDAVIRLTVTGCHFKDRTGADCCVHLENYFHDIVVSNNTFFNVSGGINVFPESSRITINNNIITLNDQLTGPPTAVDATTSTGQTGILIVQDTKGIPSEVTISNNYIEGAEFGPGIKFICPNDTISTLSNNTVVRCSTGLSIRTSSRSSFIADNVFIECGAALNTSSNIARAYNFGYRNIFDRCTEFFVNFSNPPNSYPLILHSPIIRKKVVSDGSGNQSFDILPAPSHANSLTNVTASSKDKWAVATLSLLIDKDNAITSARATNLNSNDGLAIANSGFSINGNNLEVPLFSSQSDTIDVELSLQGLVLINS